MRRFCWLFVFLSVIADALAVIAFIVRKNSEPTLISQSSNFTNTEVSYYVNSWPWLGVSLFDGHLSVLVVGIS